MAALNQGGVSAGPKLIFSCSGAADTGEIADRTARQLTKDGVGKMYCLAGVGGRVPDIMDVTRSASSILAIDGCDKDCVKHCLEAAGFQDFRHLRVTDLGMPKGQSPATDERIRLVADRAKELLSTPKS
jgi:uncharacterized metal-binding protein